MKELMIVFSLILAFSIGMYCFEKYKEDTNTKRIPFWEELLIVVGYSVFSIIILPVAIAKWAVNLTIDFKKE